MKTFKQIVEEARKDIKELFPWDVEERRSKNEETLILDIREECEFSAYHIKHSMLVPRGNPSSDDCLMLPVKRNTRTPFPNSSKRSMVKLSSSAARATAACWRLKPCSGWATGT